MNSRLDLGSHDILQDKLSQLKSLFPEAFVEGKLDLTRLSQHLGEFEVKGIERYGLNWAGKSEAIKTLRILSRGTLRPEPEKSVNFSESNNVIIEGDNLEVLKILQKSYYGKIKMIYIDPPYNTGGDFVYPDNFTDGMESYLKFSAQADEDGFKLTTNTESNGRYHSNWLSMMYPRLFLAKNLLRDDGVIFVSIDDNEVYNLRLIMNEIFGEENFMGTIIWKKKTNGNNMGYIPPVHDYFVVYARFASDKSLLGFPLSNEFITSNYSNPDNDPRGDWTTSDLSANHKGPYFSIKNQNTGETFYPPKGRYWVFSEDEVNARIADGRIIFGKSGTCRPVQKKFLSERNSMRKKAESWWDSHGMNEDGTEEIGQLIESKIFTHPKPSLTIKNIVNISSTASDIILDFFAGSGTTGHAVMELNREDGGNRQYILVQLPEPTDNLQYKTIADITRERIRRVINKIKQEEAAQLDFGDTSQDLGFKSFRLDSSNFKPWNSNPQQTPEELKRQLELYVDHLLPERSSEDILYEVIIKYGLPLTSKVEVIRLGNQDVFKIEGGVILLCLADPIEEATLQAMLKENPRIAIALDRAFHGNDQLKTNILLQAEETGESDQSRVIFKTL